MTPASGEANQLVGTMSAVPNAKSETDSRPRKVLSNGDNLDVLRRSIEDESVDLIYLDPPFTSNADCGSWEGVLFAEHDQTKAAAQI